MHSASQQSACRTRRGDPRTRASEHRLSCGWQVRGRLEKGRGLAQSGYGLRFTDYPPRNPNGGNCYGCHQLTKRELSYGTLGPSLLGFGKLRDFGDAEAKAAYEKIFNSQAALACSNMPRFGANKILTIEQIKDVVGLLMSRASPVNE